MPVRALTGVSSAMLATAMVAACGAVNEQWDLPMSPLQRPSDIPLQNRDVCAALRADRLSAGCHLMAENGSAEILIFPRLDGGLQRYSDAVDGDTVRWLGIDRFPAIQLTGSGSDGVASCRIALDVAPGQVLLIVYRQRAADPKLAPCKPARDFASTSLSALRNRSA
ncbi:hypothetical protein KIPE111705_31645 [Kibdelosporangium persicum]|uniref:DUF3558 domain-containing protein n=1 Tax=Kibdelosporangium persicum TaxID=2698649 RepID=A0ABX2EYE4_9PSEU|nr:hypothetical protein [Kibdelosporangium persicum]NRN63899.1 hypothetical protein [Kibdelosporangium persicum]